ncbi:MAG: hypothetical protein IJD45_00150 [Clostridia bacterium]|nr:hypothetical protein [Clostridia bacterium]
MEIIKKSFKLYGICILASIMCFFLVVTFNMIGTNFFGTQIGYSMQGEIEGDEENEKIILYTHKYSEGEDLKKQEYIDKGYTLTEIPMKNTTVKWDIVAQIFLLFMIGVFVYNNLWNLGFKDSNLVKIGEKREDKLKGIKIGFLSQLPAFILLAVLSIGKSTFAREFSIASYSFLNPHLHRAIYILSGSDGGYFGEFTIGDIAIIFALLLFIPILAQIAYTLGYKSIIVSEKLVYKKNQEK